jgi:hypothetical protein
VLIPQKITHSTGTLVSVIDVQRKLSIQLRGIPIFSLTALIAAFSIYSHPGSHYRATLWIFAIHNLLSCVVILRAGVGDTQDSLWRVGTILGGGLHMVWLLIVVVDLFNHILVDNCKHAN